MFGSWEQVVRRVVRLSLLTVAALSLMSATPLWGLPARIAGGTVSEAPSGGPIAGATVYVSYYDTSMGDWYYAGMASTAPDGTYAVYDEMSHGAGKYSVSVSSAGHVNGVQQRDWDGLTPLTVDFSLAASKNLASGVVTDAVTGDAIAGAQVTAEYYDASAGGWVSAAFGQTGPDGSFSVCDEWGHGAGQYRFSVGAGGYAPQESVRAWDGLSALTVDFSLVHPPTVATGTVTDALSHAPLGAARVSAEFFDPSLSEWRPSGAATTGPDGTYALYDDWESGAGQYRFAVVAAKHVYDVRYESWNGTDALTVDFELDRMPPLATGTVTAEADGHAIGTAHVKVEYHDDVSGEWWAAGEATTGPDGGYVVDDDSRFGTGEYRISASASGCVAQTLTVSRTDTRTLGADFVLRTNVAPVAAADSYRVAKDDTLTVAAPGVLGNDADADGDTMTVHAVLPPAHGTLVSNPNGSFTYRAFAGFTGTDRFTYQASDGMASSSSATVTISVGPPVAYVPLGGENRFRTAVMVSQDAFRSSGDAQAVVIATGYNWPDALGAAALAGSYHGPVLLTTPGDLPSVVDAEIRRLGVKRAFIVGSEAAVSSSVESEVAGLVGGKANVTRLGGKDRYETASLVAGQVKSRMTSLGAWDGRVIVATGRRFPDALAASPLAAAKGIPILLVKDALDPIEPTLSALAPSSVVVLGSSDAVSTDVETALKGIASTSRLQGGDRYETGVRIADYSVAQGLGWDGVAISTGENFPDALAGGAAQGVNRSVVLLTRTASLPVPVSLDLKANKKRVFSVRFLGTSSAVSDAVREAVKSALK